MRQLFAVFLWAFAQVPVMSSAAVARHATPIPYRGELVSQQTVQLDNQVEATTYLYKQSEWILKSIPQSAMLSQQMDREARQLPESERLKTMDKFEDYTQIWIVSLHKYPQATAELKRFLQPLDKPNRFHRELAYLGHNQTEAWYAYMPIYEWTSLQKEAGLTDGDDRLAAAVRGLTLDDQGSRTRNSTSWILTEAGARALPYLEPLLSTTNDTTALNVIATIQAREATELLVRIAKGPNQQQARTVSHLLKHFPHPAAKELYFHWLEAQAGKEPVYELLLICAKLDEPRTAKYLPRILDHPKTLREFRLAFELSRTANHRPISPQLLQWEQEIKSYGYASSTNYNQTRVDAAAAKLMDSPDSEAAAVIGLSLVAATTKGDWRPANQAGIRILKGVPAGETTARRIAASVEDPALKEKLNW
jgi:hypothetical protein